jgi:hypothetical protein
MYADGSSVRAARDQYFAANGFSAAGYNDNWVALGKLGPIPLGFPNTASRKRAIPMHDLHHVATGYATTWIGEAEIGAWEIAGGCTNHWAAWVLNASAFGFGLVVAPRRTYRAFMRGRRSRTLYQLGWDESLLDMTVGELRRRLRLDGDLRPSWRDRLAFAGWTALVSAPTLFAAGVVIAMVSS